MVPWKKESALFRIPPDTCWNVKHFRAEFRPIALYGTQRYTCASLYIGKCGVHQSNFPYKACLVKYTHNTHMHHTGPWHCYSMLEYRCASLYLGAGSAHIYNIPHRLAHSILYWYTNGTSYHTGLWHWYTTDVPVCILVLDGAARSRQFSDFSALGAI